MQRTTAIGAKLADYVKDFPNESCASQIILYTGGGSDLIGTLFREGKSQIVLSHSLSKMTKKRKHQEEAARALLKGMEGSEVIEKHMRKADGSAFATSTLNNQVSQTLLGQPPPHSGDVSQRRWTSCKIRLAECVPPMVVDARGLYRTLRVVYSIASLCEVRPSKFISCATCNVM